MMTSGLLHIRNPFKSTGHPPPSTPHPPPSARWRRATVGEFATWIWFFFVWPFFCALIYEWKRGGRGGGSRGEGPTRDIHHEEIDIHAGCNMVEYSVYTHTHTHTHTHKTTAAVPLLNYAPTPPSSIRPTLCVWNMFHFLIISERIIPGGAVIGVPSSPPSSHHRGGSANEYQSMGMSSDLPSATLRSRSLGSSSQRRRFWCRWDPPPVRCWRRPEAGPILSPAHLKHFHILISIQFRNQFISIIHYFIHSERQCTSASDPYFDFNHI